MKYHGVESIELPSCFEKSIPPSYNFLRWLLENLDQLTWPNKGRARFSTLAQAKREDLFGWHGAEKQADTQREALALLVEKGARRAHGKWWSFEGTTQVDCFLETEHLILLIEGKRTESLSTSIYWYQGRNQVVRNLEVSQELANGKAFALLVVAEEEIEPLSNDVINSSLPHFTPEERNDLIQHYVGCLTWREVCSVVGIPFESLPDTVPDWVESL